MHVGFTQTVLHCSPVAAIVNGGGAVVEEEVVVVRVGVRLKLVRDAPSHGSVAALIRTGTIIY